MSDWVRDVAMSHLREGLKGIVQSEREVIGKWAADEIERLREALRLVIKEAMAPPYASYSDLVCAVACVARAALEEKP